jgi:very-short-patch-repair endonuclease
MMSSASSQESTPQANFFAELMKASRKKLLDLSLRNRLLNYAPADPEHRDDGRAHKFLKLQGRLKPVWERLVAEDKQLKISRFNPVEIGNALKRLNESLKKANRAEAGSITEKVRELNAEVQEIESLAAEGHVWVDQLGDEQYQKRLRRLSDEAKSLEDTTGDSAFFLACGFLRWPERPKSSRLSVDPAKDGVSTHKFAPLLLVKVSLTDEGKGATGRKKFRIVREDDPQDNQSLKAKLKEEWDFTIPDLPEDATAAEYFAVVRRAITLSKLVGFEVQETLALGFFNFARYRLWLDLDPRQWKGVSPEGHPIVKSILAVAPLDTTCPRVIDATRDDAIAEEIARHQETDDIPIIRDADTSQYSALLYARKGKSLVVIGPPGSGKSQTITNLVAAMIANGKKVLFVAQKLPALDVVARRIRESGLGDFCLQFYSAKHDGEPDRKPVTPLQVHAQLTRARNILGSKPRSISAERRAPVLAKKLNAHAATIHGIHPVYGESLQRILCTALKLKEDAMAAWGESWDESLLAVILPEGAALSAEWIEGRSRLLAEIARLRHESGDFWQGWTPENLTVLDVPAVEASLEVHRRSLKRLAEWCETIAPSLINWDQCDLKGLADECVGVSVPTNFSDAFIRAIASNDAMRLAHEMERELANAEKAETAGTAVLFLVPEGASATAAFATHHLLEVERCVEQKATYADARVGLEQLDALLRLTDILQESLPLHIDGLVAFAGERATVPGISLLVSIAQMEEGTFRPAPKQLLPALARQLVGEPTLADAAMIVADHIDDLMSKRATAASLFAQTLRAEKFVGDRFILLLKDANEAGLGAVPVSQTATIEALCTASSNAAARLVAFDPAVIAAAAGFEGIMSNRRARELGLASAKIGIADLAPPAECDPKLVQAWAKGTISEGEARAAAMAQEKADNLKREIAAILGQSNLTASTTSVLRQSISAAEALGLSDAKLTEFPGLVADLFHLEQSMAAILPTLNRLGLARELKDFDAVAKATHLVSLIGHVPDLVGVNSTRMVDETVLAELREAIARAIEIRSTTAPGIAKILDAAATRIRSCLQAAYAAEQVAGTVSGIRRPSTLRELRSIGAAIPILRSMTSLPLGCDVVQMSSEQYAATIRHLAAASARLELRVASLPADFDFVAFPSSSEARRTLDLFRGKQNSVFRVFSGEWRAARTAIVRCAPKISMVDAIAAYELASEIRAEEEVFAADPSGTAALSTYFRGYKTDWQPFLAFAASVESLTRALDGFERNERVVAAWRAESGSVHAIANACRQFDAAAAECEAACPDLFGAVDGPFRPDVPITTARERATATLTRIDGLLASTILMLPEVRDLPAPARTLTESIEAASAAEREIVALSTKAKQALGDAFAGGPADWRKAQTVTEWVANLHAVPAFATLLKEIVGLCVDSPSHVVKFSHDSVAASMALDAVRKTLNKSRVRPDPQSNVTDFFGRVREWIAKFDSGAGLLLGGPEDGVETMRYAAEKIDELVFELGRSQMLRDTVAPKLLTTSAVEITLNWALSLATRNAPESLVAFLSECPSRVSDVKALLDLCAVHSNCLESLREGGCSNAIWAIYTSAVADVSEMAPRVIEALVTARQCATECGAKADCTVAEMLTGAEASRDCVLLGAKRSEWIARLGCDPFSAEDPGAAVRETIFWTESLHTDRIPVGVMVWLVSAHADQRMQWWASIVRNCKAWRTQRSSIRQSTMPEFDETTCLGEWRADLSMRQTSLSLAIEQLARVVRRPETALAKLRDAAELLRNSAESAIRADLLRVKLPGADIVKTSTDVAENRAYAAWVVDRPIEISLWANKVSAPDVCAHVKILRPLLNEVVKTRQRLREAMKSFGPCGLEGPSGMLSEAQCIRSAVESTESAIFNLHGLSPWAALHRETKRATKLGVDRIATEVIAKKATPEEASIAFKAGVAWQKAMVVWKENPNLERFRTSRHEDTRTEFAKEDIAAVTEQNRQRIIFAIHEKTGGGIASWGNGYVDQLLLNEASKRRKLMPVRKLVENAGKRMQELCPCWLATPSAIAQFMAPSTTEFDLIIMDEASQLTPEDSWGAIARGTQVVVVGDPKQMPPSNFFENTADDDDEEKQELQNGEAMEKPQGPILKGHQQESVLKAAEACLPQVWLNWHYRSLHEGLIAAANQLSYDRRLVLFPSSHVNHTHLGVRHTFVEDGTATTGQVKNPNEAAAIVERLVVIAEEFTTPTHRRLVKAPHSVGVIAMNIHQQETIKELIDFRRNNDPQFGRNLAILEANENEPFFVRNLENVQGDERDVIIISTTYGPNTKGGTPTQRFTPINYEGGERRFNVLITRAKWRMEVFTSLRASQLTSAQVGVQHMRSFLEYCETGTLPHAGAESGRWFDSPFEAHVHAVLEAKGYSVKKQVGVAGYFLDLAIKDPLVPDRYVLGIECDGATYHSSRSARDRDRLREQVLNERGWEIHRIWSTEWFYNNAAVRKALFAAVDDALGHR